MRYALHAMLNMFGDNAIVRLNFANIIETRQEHRGCEGTGFFLLHENLSSDLQTYWRPESCEI